MHAHARAQQSHTHTHTHTHTYIPWNHTCVTRTVGCETSHKYTNMQNYSVKYYKPYTKIQGVPLPTKPGSSLIILPLTRILQRNLKRTYLNV